MSIQKDLRTGDDGEQKVIALLKKSGWDAAKNVDKATRSFYDIEVQGKRAAFTLEVKNDIYALKSGNIAVEFFNSKSQKPSGITITKANLWVFVVGEAIWVTHTDTLRTFINDTKPHRIVYSGGDSNADLMLYKIDAILPVIFKQVDELKPEHVTETLMTLLGIL
jgi:hypothetical protein